VPRKLSKDEAKRFLATPEGQAWLARKIEERNARKLKKRLAEGPAPERFRRTRFPFEATINGRKAIVSREIVINYPEEDYA
jgi:hypothetical protein